MLHLRCGHKAEGLVIRDEQRHVGFDCIGSRSYNTVAHHHYHVPVRCLIIRRIQICVNLVGVLVPEGGLAVVRHEIGTDGHIAREVGLACV